MGFPNNNLGPKWAFDTLEIITGDMPGIITDNHTVLKSRNHRTTSHSLPPEIIPASGECSRNIDDLGGCPICPTIFIYRVSKVNY